MGGDEKSKADARWPAASLSPSWTRQSVPLRHACRVVRAVGSRNDPLRHAEHNALAAATDRAASDLPARYPTTRERPAGHAETRERSSADLVIWAIPFGIC